MKPTIFKPRMGQDDIQHPLCLLVECNLLDLNRNQIFNVMWSKTSILCADLGPGRWGTVWCGYLLRHASSQVWISLNETEFLSHVAIATCPSPCIMTDASMLWFGSTPTIVVVDSAAINHPLISNMQLIFGIKTVLLRLICIA